MLTVLALIGALVGAALPDSVIYPSLVNRGMSDCRPAGLPVPVSGSAASQASICRVRRAYTADDVLGRLAAGRSAWRDGDDLTFAWKGAADAVELVGGIGAPMAHLVGKDLWVLTVHADSLDRAVVGYTFFASSPAGTSTPPPPTVYWRGPRALAEPPRSAVLHGRVVYDTVTSAAIGSRRGLTIYIPPQRGTAAIADVIYMADGQSLPEYAPLLDTLILMRRLPRLLVVGINSDPGRIMPDPAKPGEYLPDGRSREYLPGVDSARFAAHERFLLDEVLPHVERTYGAPRARNRRALFGFSNGATFAAAMGLSHPDRFGAVIAFSPGGGAKSFAAIPQSARHDRRPVRGPKLYVSGGMYEPGFRTNARALAELFRVSGAPVTLREPAGGHDEVIWQLSLPAALMWSLRSHGASTQ